MSEPIDLNNVIEVNQIKKILKDKPDLIVFFNEILTLANNSLNTEPTLTSKITIEPYEEPILSDHESDDDFMPDPCDDY